MFIGFKTEKSFPRVLASGALPATRSQPSLYPPPVPPYTAIEATLRLHFSFCPLARTLAVCGFIVSAFLFPANAQQAPQKPTEKPNAKASTPTEPQNPAQFELLETKYRFEANGDSRKEVHARVHINTELGVRQFARLNFDYNRSFQSIDIPLVHITHPSGGTADILPSAITDNPNPAVVNAPAYQDVRVKSVRILGLEPGDNLEYRVITATTHHPLAPDFWLDHSFDRTGVVSQEIFELDLPASRDVQIHINPAIPATSNAKSGEGNEARVIYRWDHFTSPQRSSDKDSSPKDSDVLLTTLATWALLSEKLDAVLQPSSSVGPEVEAKARELTRSSRRYEDELEAIYDFVSQRINTVDLPLGATKFRVRAPGEILSSGAANQEDKYVLFSALAATVGISTNALLTGAPVSTESQLPTPSPFTHLLVGSFQYERSVWLDPSVEVAPFGMIPSNLRGNPALTIENWTKLQSNSPLRIQVAPCWLKVESTLPFRASQRVSLDASLDPYGKLTAKVHYALRGDNELLLRVAFHQSPKEKWKELAQLLSLSDGFRGQVTSVNASDPYATREPFTVDYEITQPKFVDWSKKPLRIPALLPQLGLPDPPAKPAPGAATAPIELGTPLEVETRMTLHLPPGTTATAPTGTSVQRDYATFSSQYAAPTQYTRKGLTVTASRHLNFLLRQVLAERAADYNAFLRAVLNDEAQDFTLDRESPPAAAPKAAPAQASPPSSPKP